MDSLWTWCVSDRAHFRAFLLVVIVMILCCCIPDDSATDAPKSSVSATTVALVCLVTIGLFVRMLVKELCFALSAESSMPLVNWLTKVFVLGMAIAPTWSADKVRSMGGSWLQ